jgi:hypothetical protein
MSGHTTKNGQHISAHDMMLYTAKGIADDLLNGKDEWTIQISLDAYRHWKDEAEKETSELLTR